MNKTAITVIGLLTLVIIGLAYLVHEDARKKVVYEVCQYSRTTNTISEKTCADLQDVYSYAYMCKQNNNSPKTKCWVE